MESEKRATIRWRSIAGATSVIINETMAQRFWPNDEPVGKTILIGGPKGKVHRVIGIAKNTPINAVGEAPEPYLYLAYWPNLESEITYLIETSTDPAALAATARQVLKSVDSRLDRSNAQTLEPAKVWPLLKML